MIVFNDDFDVVRYLGVPSTMMTSNGFIRGIHYSMLGFHGPFMIYTVCAYMEINLLN